MRLLSVKRRVHLMNERIAQFMGLDYNVGGMVEMPVADSFQDLGIVFSSSTQYRFLNYHNDWNILMDVRRNLDYRVQFIGESMQKVFVAEPFQRQWYLNAGSGNIIEAHEALHDAIDWFMREFPEQF